MIIIMMMTTTMMMMMMTMTMTMLMLLMMMIIIIIGVLRTISKNAKTWHGKLDTLDIVGSAQLPTILGTARILRKMLCF